MLARVYEEEDGWMCDITIHTGTRFDNFTDAVIYAHEHGYNRVVVVFKT